MKDRKEPAPPTRYNTYEIWRADSLADIAKFEGDLARVEAILGQCPTSAGMQERRNVIAAHLKGLYDGVALLDRLIELEKNAC